VTGHVRTKLALRCEPALARRCLDLVDSVAGGTLVRDANGGWWRAYRFIEGSVTHELIRDHRQAFLAARAYGEFQRLLADLPPPPLAETIPDFHVTPARVALLEDAVARDPHRRVAHSRAEVELALARAPLADALLAEQRTGALPERVVHNDTKLNNVLFDADTGDALCVVDLDTVMSGLAPYDFGDLVRSCALAQEDDASALAGFDLGLFEALLRGYLEGAGDMLNEAERRALPLACRLITYELGVRFLTDFIEGDHYFKTVRAGQNLERAHAQFALLQAMEREDAAMQRLVERIATPPPP
jgi:Ser/Thr protein kinase RdoA (MazF antagonist)